MATPAKSRVLPMKRKNLAPKPLAGSAGYDVVIGPRKKHFTSHADAYRHAMAQQNKGVHSVFVIVDGATGERHEFTRGGKNPKKSKASDMDKAYAMTRYNFPGLTREKFERDVLANRKPGETLNQATIRLVRGTLPKGKKNPKGTCPMCGKVIKGVPKGEEHFCKRCAKIFDKEQKESFAKHAKRNPESGAVAMRESFTGIPSKKTVVVGEDIHVHSHLAALGELVSMRVKTLKGDTFDICFGKEENPKARKSALGKVRGWIDRRGKAVSKILKSTSDLWINPKRTNSGGVVLLCCTEDGKNLMIEGGSQALDLKALNMGEFADKESVIVGEIKTIDYFATKDWKDGKKPETAIYTHKLNEETGGPRPMLRYSTRDKRCYIDGGLYKINKPLTGTSAGIEN